MARYFSKTELESLAKQLATLGTKDTELEEAVSLKPDDRIAIIQDGTNKTIAAGVFISSSEGSGIQDIQITGGGETYDLPVSEDKKVNLKLGSSLDFDYDKINVVWTE